jgi:hypothetical protein
LVAAKGTSAGTDRYSLDTVVDTDRYCIDTLEILIDTLAVSKGGKQSQSNFMFIFLK